ncbi:MAG: ferredoxin family protein [Rikenellaceae bacterium]
MITALKLRFKKPKEVRSLKIIADRCKSCYKCVDMCKRKVFEMDQKQGVAIVAHTENCVGCGKCVQKMCRFGAIELVLA